MSKLKEISGNIFASKAQTLVNTVNCVGAMGAGIALECRLRYPKMYERYTSLCKQNLINIGSLWLYKAPDRWILNFPTKLHWRDPSKEEYLHAGLQKFMDTYREKGIKSIAFPLLGASNGGIDARISQEIMESYLSKCDIPVEIFHYAPAAMDAQFEHFRERFLEVSPAKIKTEAKLRPTVIQNILDALQDSSICQLSRLASLPGIGRQSVERAFKFISDIGAQDKELYQATFDIASDTSIPSLAVQEASEKYPE